VSREHADIAPYDRLEYVCDPTQPLTRSRTRSSSIYNGLHRRIDFRTLPKHFSWKAIWSYRQSIVKFTATRSFSHPRRAVFVIIYNKTILPPPFTALQTSLSLFSVHWNTSDSIITPRNGVCASHVERGDDHDVHDNIVCAVYVFIDTIIYYIEFPYRRLMVSISVRALACP